MIHHVSKLQSSVCSEAMVDKKANEWKGLGSGFWALAVPIDLVASFVKVKGQRTFFFHPAIYPLAPTPPVSIS